MWLIVFFLSACSSEENRLQPDMPKSSFSILSIEAKEDVSACLEDFTNVIAEYDVDIVSLYRTLDNESNDLAYTLSKSRKRWQAHSFGNFLNDDYGIGVLTESIVNETRKCNLDNILSVVQLDYLLDNGEKLMLLSCQFDENDIELSKSQAYALNNYADKLGDNVLILVSLPENGLSEVIQILSNTYCNLYSLSEDDISDDSRIVNYVLSPIGDGWETESVVEKEHDRFKSVLVRLSLN